MKLGELTEGLEGALPANAEGDLQVGALRMDSRDVQPGDIFFALTGVNADGHDYIPQAIAAGAALVVAQRDLGMQIPLILVPDARKALAYMASRFNGMPARRLRMVGVTGTNGKTTVTHIIKGLLDRLCDKPVGLIGTNTVSTGVRSLPTERTTPDAPRLHALLREMVEADCGYCVMEVSSHALAQHRTWGIQFSQALFTNLTQDHMDYHFDMEGYFEVKSALFDQADIGIVNLDDPFGRRLGKKLGLDSISYSIERDQADVTAKNIKLKPDRVEFEAVTHSEIARIEWATPGIFSVYNALAAVTSVLAEGLSLRDIAAAFREIPPVTGRMEVIPGPEDVTVIIDYAHTPDALANVLSAAREGRAGRLITVFGCGGDRDRSKRPLMAQAAASESDMVVVTSDNPRTEDPMAIIDEILAGIPKDAPPQLLVEVNRVTAIQRALEEARPGDVVMLCGKGHETYQEIQGDKKPMDEREIVSSILPCIVQGKKETR